MIGQMLDAVTEMEKAARKLRHDIYEWAEEDKMTKAEWDQFANWLASKAATSGFSETVGSVTYYRIERFIVEETKTRLIGVTKCRDTAEAQREYEGRLLRAYKESA